MLKKKCKELRKRVQTKEQEVQETRSKIERATKKQEEEKLFQELKDQEIAEKKAQVALEEEDHNELRKQLDTRNQYKAFLYRVCDENEGNAMYDEVDAILLKHASLMDAAKNLADNNKEDEVISLRLVYAAGEHAFIAAKYRGDEGEARQKL